MTDEDMADLRAAYDTAAPGSPAAARAAHRLGRALAARYFRDGGPDTDRDEAVELLDESLGAPQDQPSVTHIGIALLLFFRVLPIGPRPDDDGSGATAVATALTTGALNDPALIPDRDRALAHLRWVLAHEPAEAEVVPYAEALVAMLELVGATNLFAGIARLAAVAPRLSGGLGAMADLLTVYAGEGEPDDPVPAFDRVLAQLPAGHRLRPVILAEAGVLLARRGHVAGLPDQLAGLGGALSEALAAVRDDDPFRDETIRRLTGTLLSATAYTGDRDRVDQLVATAGALAVEGGWRERFLHGMALTLRGRLDDDPGDLGAAVAELRAALDAAPPGDDLRPAVRGMLGALLSDRHLARGVRADAEAGAALAAGVAGAADGDLAAAGLLSRAVLAVQRRDAAELDPLIDRLTAVLGALPAGYPWRSRLDAALGLARLTRATVAARPGDMADGLALLRRAGDELAVEMTGRPALRAAGAAAAALDGLARGDRDAVADAVARLDAIVAATAPADPDRVALLALRAQIATIRGERAVDRWEEARAALAARPAHPLTAHVYTGLADACHAAGDAAGAAAHGLAALRAYGDDVLLQSGAAHAVESARHAAALARRVADRCLAGDRAATALTALELGRGLVLHTATTAATVPDRLRAAGHPDLAAEWESAPGPSGAAAGAADTVGFIAGTMIAVPSDLRPRVLDALHDRSGPGVLAVVPAPDEIAAAARAADADVVVYLLGGDGGTPGRLLAVHPGGELRCLPAPDLRLDHPDLAAYLAAHDRRTAGDPATAVAGWRDALGRVCDWAWTALAGPLLADLGDTAPERPHRVILVPLDSLGYVPWHAARAAGRHACEPFAFSYAASARQLAAAHPPRADGPVVLLADPTRDLHHATAEVDALRRTAYPASLVLGAAEPADGAGTPADVVAALAAGPAVVHLACHARTDGAPDRSHLVLAGGDLPVARILAETGAVPAAPGGLIVLSACSTDLSPTAYDEALTLATAFLATGASGVVGSRWPVDDRTTACLMVMFHHFRVAAGLGDRDALRAAQRWMLDRRREIPPALAAVLPPLIGGSRAALAEPFAWAPFTHQGR